MASQSDLFPATWRRHPQNLSVIDHRLRGATFVEHKVQSVVNSPESTGMHFWSINPYIGCELGCTYCYARYAHRYTMQRSHDAGQVSKNEFERHSTSGRWEVFEHQIFVKQRQSVLYALERDLTRVRRRQARGHTHPIVIGTATDPYQPAERAYGITRAILERLLLERNLAVGIITKNSLIRRDIPLLFELMRRHRVSVYISLITTDPGIIKLFEARSPMPSVRLKTLRMLRDAGINAGLIVAPILPGITDTIPSIRALAQAIKDAHGAFAHPSPLRLTPALHMNFLPIIDEHFPHLAAKYRRVYRGTGAAPKSYTEALTKRFRFIAQELDLPVEDPVLDRHGKTATSRDQYALWAPGGNDSL